MKAKLKRVKGREVTFDLPEELDISNLERENDAIMAEIEFLNKDSITSDQRNHFWALMGDYEEYTGTPAEPASYFFKVNFMIEKNLTDYPSLKVNQMTKETARELLDFIIVYFIEHGIPFRKQQWYLSMDVSNMLYALTMKRICWVTGKPNADIHHATNLVGMGRDRRKHNHIESSFMSLSREAHNEIHNIGYTAFCEKYHVKAIKLSQEDLKKLGVM